MRQKRSGISLVELLITVALVATIISGATLAFGQMVRMGRLKQATELVIGALREAQVQAFQDGNPWRITVDAKWGRLYLEPASDPRQADAGCGTGYSSPIRTYELPPGVTLGDKSGDCVVFGQAGRLLSRAPYVVQPPPTKLPTIASSIIRLTDGHAFTPEELELQSFEPIWGRAGTATWYRSEMPDLLVDLRELRYLSTICVGLISAQEFGVGYPDHIKVMASTVAVPTAESDWLLPPLLDTDLPADPIDFTRERTCIPVNVNDEIRHLRISLTDPNGVRADYWALDEIDLGPRFFTVQYGTDSRIVEVNPTTGRVTSRKGS